MRRRLLVVAAQTLSFSTENPPSHRSIERSSVPTDIWRHAVSLLIALRRTEDPSRTRYLYFVTAYDLIDLCREREAFLMFLFNAVRALPAPFNPLKIRLIVVGAEVRRPAIAWLCILDSRKWLRPPEANHAPNEESLPIPCEVRCTRVTCSQLQRSVNKLRLLNQVTGRLAWRR
jgi:hypothetical protein